MNILQLCTGFAIGGIGRHVVDLGAWLRDRGHEVLLCGNPGPLANPTNDVAFAPLPVSAVTSHGGTTFSRVGALVRCSIELRRLLERHPVDLIHAHETAPTIVARLATLGRPVPILFTCHGYARGHHKRVARVGLFLATTVVTPSQRVADELCADGILPRDRVRVIGIGISELPSVSPRRIEELRSEHLGEHGQILIVVTARLSPQKGIDVLVDVIREVVRVRNDVRVVVLGGGRLEGAAREWSRKAGLSEVITFLGATREVPSYLRAADIFLLTSRWEALPLSIVEAFRAGLPVIATDCGGVRELVDERVGEVLAPGDVRGISQAVLRLVEDSQLRARLGKNALSRSRLPRFSPDQIHSNLEELYWSLLPAGTGASGLR